MWYFESTLHVLHMDRRWQHDAGAHRDFTRGASFAPFSVEIARGFGPHAKELMETVVERAGNVRDVSVFGWQTARASTDSRTRRLYFKIVANSDR